MRVDRQTSPALTGDFAKLATGFLRGTGIEKLAVAQESADGSSGQITRDGNNFLRWKRDSGVLEVVAGDLELRPGANVPPAGSRSSGVGPARPYDVEVDPRILSRFLTGLGLSGTG